MFDFEEGVLSNLIETEGRYLSFHSDTMKDFFSSFHPPQPDPSVAFFSLLQSSPPFPFFVFYPVTSGLEPWRLHGSSPPHPWSVFIPITASREE